VGANPKPILHLPTRISTRRNLTRIQKYMATYISATALARKIGSSPQAVLDTAAELQLGAKGAYRNSPLTLDESACVKVHSRILEKEIGTIKAQIAKHQAERLKIAKHMGYLAPLARMNQHPATADLEELARLTSNIPDSPTASATYQDRVAYACKTQTIEPRVAAIQARISKLL
jgi:hypothetical protein